MSPITAVRKKKKKKKGLSPTGIARKINRIIDEYPHKWREVVRCWFASLISEVSILNVFDSKHDYCDATKVLFHFLDNTIVGDDLPDIFNTVGKDIEQGDEIFREFTIQTLLPGPSPVESVDDIGEDPFPMPSERTIKYKTLKKMQAVAEGCEFAKGVDAKMLEIIQHLFTSHETGTPTFYITRIKPFMPFLKAWAFINGHTEIELTDLHAMSNLWVNYADYPEYIAIVDAAVNDYNAVASTYRTRVYDACIRIESANNAIREGKTINFYNPDIPENTSLDTLIAEAIADIGIIQAEATALADGAPKTATHTKPLYELLDYIKDRNEWLSKLKHIRY